MTFKHAAPASIVPDTDGAANISFIGAKAPDSPSGRKASRTNPEQEHCNRCH